jgi:hypothetical protein
MDFIHWFIPSYLSLKWDFKASKLIRNGEQIPIIVIACMLLMPAGFTSVPSFHRLLLPLSKPLLHINHIPFVSCVYHGFHRCQNCQQTYFSRGAPPSLLFQPMLQTPSKKLRRAAGNNIGKRAPLTCLINWKGQFNLIEKKTWYGAHRDEKS